MKTVYWYTTGLFVCLMYIYLLAVQYVRGAVDFNYHKYDAMTNILFNYSSKYPDLCRLYSVGKSVQGNNTFSYDNSLIS